MRWHGADDTRESNQTLWLLAASPTVWAMHFLACYVTAAVWCAKAPDPWAPLGEVRWAVGLFTAVALAGIGLTGWLGWRRHSHGSGAVPHDFDTAQDRHRFLGFATALLSGLSAVAVLFVALVILYFDTCR
jgi:hypothetical protein